MYATTLYYQSEISEPIVYGWESPVEISTVGDSILSTEGTLVLAHNYGTSSDTIYTVNGISFDPFETSEMGSFSNFDSDINQEVRYSAGNVSADFDDALDSFSFEFDRTGAYLDYSGLTIGEDYLIQVLISNQSNPNTDLIFMQIAGESDTTGVNPNIGQSIICRFTATATTQRLSFTWRNLVNCMQIRQLS